MTAYDIAAQLPTIDVLRQRCKALAMHDTIIGGDYYTYDRAGGADEAASMRNGSREEYDIVFDGVPAGFTPGGRFSRNEGVLKQAARPGLRRSSATFPGLRRDGTGISGKDEHEGDDDLEPLD
ncbi:hypothetical protein OG470_20990 [Micromonospora sp. NBC_00389]|uniref:hypothetical protein n=1 Tax=Micromonospora sp. NBC_00389 TaxID=2903586 RepID=UPI002E23F22F